MSSFEEFDKLLAERGNLTKLFGVLKPIAKHPMKPERLGALITYFRLKDIGLAGGANITVRADHIFTGGYKTYHEWFTRKLTHTALMVAKDTAKKSSVVISNECVVESVGRVGDTSSILRLKKPTDHIAADLAMLGVPQSHLFVNMKLLTSHYHHVHSPVRGTIKRAVPIHANYPLFGRASLNFIEIDSPIGPVFMLIVGEAVVQDFNYAVSPTDTVDICDRLGNFTWGSQVVMLFPGKLEDIRIKRRQYKFVGDSVLA